MIDFLCRPGFDEPSVFATLLTQSVAAPLDRKSMLPISVQIDRARALQFGITVNDIGNNVTASFSSSEQV